MNYAKKLLLAGTFIVLTGLVGAVLGVGPYPVYGASVEDNIVKLKETNSCPGCDLHGADLRYALLNDADLGGDNLAGANLEGAYLDTANLSGADLSGADLEGADLTNANVKGANFVGAKGLTPEQVKELKKGDARVD